MTMRKYEKIRENILMMQQFNTKRFEKEKEITPGPDHYNPSYSLIQNDGFAVIKYEIYFYINFSFQSEQN